jgi:hypothetical protein
LIFFEVFYQVFYHCKYSFVCKGNMQRIKIYLAESRNRHWAPDFNVRVATGKPSAGRRGTFLARLLGPYSTRRQTGLMIALRLPGTTLPYHTQWHHPDSKELSL